MLLNMWNAQVHLDFLKYLLMKGMNPAVWYVYFFLEQVNRQTGSVLKFEKICILNT